MYQNFIIPYLYDTQDVSGDTSPIIRSLKLQYQLCLTMLTIYTSNNLSRMKNQRLPVQF